MSKFTDERSSLVRDIVNGKCSKKKTIAEISRLEQTYPEESFGYYQPTPKERPWTMEYLKELQELFYCGAGSKEFILYMAEVSDEVYKAKKLRKVILITLLIVAAVAVGGIVIKSLLGE